MRSFLPPAGARLRSSPPGASVRVQRLGASARFRTLGASAPVRALGASAGSSRAVVSSLLSASATAALLVGLPAAASAAAKPPAFHGTASLGTTGRLTVAWKASAKTARAVKTVRVEARATTGGKPRTATSAGAYRRSSKVVVVKSTVSKGTSTAPVPTIAQVTWRAQLCAAPLHGKRSCGAWSKRRHPTAASPSVNSTATAPAPATTTPTVAPTASDVPSIGGCPVLPATSAFNQDVSSLPVDPRSSAYLASIGIAAHVHPDFGAADLGQGPGGFGIPYTVVPQAQPLLPVSFTDYGDESDPGPYPVPLDAPVEGGPDADGDRHVLTVQQGTCRLYEMGNAYPQASGWKASGGAVFDLATGVRASGSHPGWTSADAAGLPILPGLARYDEVAGGAIRHALRMTVSRTQKAYIAPASHWASSDTNPNLPPMGLRLRMRADFDTSRFTGQSLVIATALKRYGLIVADNGSPWYISGAPSTSWDDDDLGQLKTVPGSAFEVVQTGAVVTP